MSGTANVRRGTVMILVAERDPTTMELKRRLESDEGFEVHVELNGRVAVDEARRRQPDLLVVDVLTPGLSGLQVCQALKSDPETSSIPIVIFSALDLRERGLRAGADGILLKPRDTEKLVARVRSAASRTRSSASR